MTRVYITIDTEYSSGLVKDLSEASRRENFARSISCNTPEGPVGITHKLDMFERHGIKAVFFVDPMPALVWGSTRFPADGLAAICTIFTAMNSIKSSNMRAIR